MTYTEFNRLPLTARADIAMHLAGDGFLVGRKDGKITFGLKQYDNFYIECSLINGNVGSIVALEFKDLHPDYLKVIKMPT